MWYVSLKRNKNEVMADIFEISPEYVENFKTSCGKRIYEDSYVCVDKLFDNYEDARKFYDEFTASAYKMEL